MTGVALGLAEAGPEPVAALLAHARTTHAVQAVAMRTEWDMETMMPPGAAHQRAEEMAALAEMLQARRADPRLGDWLAAAPADPGPVAAAQMRHIRRDHDRAVRVPGELAAAIARATSLGQSVWEAARGAADFAAFAPRLAEIVALKREEAAALSDGCDPYDALLDGYEPGARAADLEAMFATLRPRIVALRDAALDAGPGPAVEGRFEAAAQLALARELATAFGYDFDRGRLDLAVHPSSSGSGADVRITTRIDPADPFNCLYATIHEVGHAGYEQAIDPAFALTPLGSGVSMGVHESQSRLYENQLGRSRAFCDWLWGRMRAAFGDMGLSGPEQFHAAVNRVEAGFIRTEADELGYNLHVLLRFDLERDLIAGRLEARDLEEAWNARFLADFGLAVPDAGQGCLQDVHWPSGAFGYFPTYTLGNVYAGCLHAALRRDLPDLDDDLAAGDPGPAATWLGERVHRPGGLLEPRELIARACGAPPSEAPLLAYLEAKYAV